MKIDQADSPIERWLVAAIAGDHAAYAQLVDAWQGRIFALCHAKLLLRADAEDAAQEVFLRGFQQLHEIREPAAIGGWFRGIAQHVCVDLIRRNRRAERLLQSKIDIEGPMTCRPAPQFEDEERSRIQTFVSRLPEEIRAVVLLHYYENLTYDQIAEWLGIARSSVNVRLSKGRELLRHQLVAVREGST